MLMLTGLKCEAELPWISPESLEVQGNSNLGSEVQVLPASLESATQPRFQENAQLKPHLRARRLGRGK